VIDRLKAWWRADRYREIYKTGEFVLCDPTKFHLPDRFRWIFDFDQVYASRTQGHCLEPLLISGDVIICTPDISPQKGDLVTFWHDGENAPVVKRFLGNKPEGLHMVQDNPAGHFYMPPNTPMHRVIAIIPHAEAFPAGVAEFA